ncbi:MAG: hypothetical protein KDB00_25875 [Planctomycetales bacterium]|nr:hypothetical protein [Planctomycetales bacterium]
MRKLSVAVCLITIVLGGFLVAGVQAEDKGEAKQPIVTTRVYKVGDLPVFTQTKDYAPEMLMALIQKTVSPKDWETKGGTSTIAPYPQNVSLIISTTPKNHDKIVKLLERFRDSK